MAKRKDLRLQPRWFQAIRAFLGGYFWLPCPVCRESFGGHEWAGDLYQGNGSGMGTCANCAAEAARRSKKVYQLEALAEERIKINKLPIHDPNMPLEQKHELIGYEKGIVKAQELLEAESH